MLPFLQVLVKVFVSQIPTEIGFSQMVEIATNVVTDKFYCCNYSNVKMTFMFKFL